MEETLISSIEYSLSHYLYSNAVFMAERLFAINKGELARQLLGSSYLSVGKPHQAYEIVSQGKSERNRYLAALSAFKMGKWSEAQDALLGRGKGEKLSTAKENKDLPNGAAGYYLMGLISKKLNQKENAIKNFSQSLKLYPFLWSAYESIASMGADIDPAEFFGVEASNDIPSAVLLPETIKKEPENLANTKKIDQTLKITPNLHPPVKALPSTPSIAKSIVKQILSNSPDISKDSGGFTLRVNPLLETKFIGKGLQTASPFTAPKLKAVETVEPPKVAPQNQRKKATQVSSKILTATPSGGVKRGLFHPDVATPAKVAVPQVRQQPGNKVVQNSNKVTKPAEVTHEPMDIVESKRTLGTKESTSEAMQEAPVSKVIDKQHKEMLLEGTVKLLNLLRNIGDGIRLLNKFHCQEAIQLFQKLPQEHYNTGWVLCHVAKAYFEMVQYVKAKQFFEEVQALEPYRTTFMELYSTILWHLKEEVQLSYLAQQLTELDRNSAASWCAVGNCFSLQKEHETALKFLKRAILCEEDFTYAYTLSGHEYISTENWDKAMTCFRNALRLDPRHYNAWYGLGMIYYSQEKYPSAEYHFRKALQINPRSSVLNCYVGMVLNEQKKYEDALRILSNAIQIDPKNTLAQFKKATVLFNMEEYDEALQELVKLKEKAPKEAPIYILMGKVYKKKKFINKAMKCFNTALDFDAKSANYIKNVISKLGNQELDSDGEDEEF